MKSSNDWLRSNVAILSMPLTPSFPRFALAM
jgi:hypothetical protein